MADTGMRAATKPAPEAETKDAEVQALKDAVGAIGKRLDALLGGRSDGDDDGGKADAGKADAGKADAGKADAGKADAGKADADTGETSVKNTGETSEEEKGHATEFRHWRRHQDGRR